MYQCISHCRPCMFSAAMWINNRALMPCQEYGSFSTWEAYIRAPADGQVIMSAEQDAVCCSKENGVFSVDYFVAVSPW